MNPLILYSATGCLLIGLVTGWTIRDWKAGSEAASAMERAEKLREKIQTRYDDLSIRYETDRAAADNNQIIRQMKLRTIYRDVPVYSDCAAPDTARSLLQNSVDETNARITGKPVGPVPEATPSSQPAE